MDVRGLGRHWGPCSPLPVLSAMRAYFVQASMKARPNGVRATVRRGTTPSERISSPLEYMHPSLSKLLNDVRTSTLGSLLIASTPRKYADIASSGSLHAQTAFEEPSGLTGLASSIAVRFLTSSVVISPKPKRMRGVTRPHCLRRLR